MVESGPFSRTHEAARQVRAAMSGHGAAHREGFSARLGVPETARPELARVGHGQIGMLAFTAEDSPYRQQTRRSRWPWLLTVIVVAVFVEIVWFAYEEVNRLRPAGLVTHEELAPSVTTPPPKPLLKPLETLMAEAVEPPKPRFKPR